jgi:hypothetical protein
MPLILGTNSIKDTGFNVANSLRFNSGSSDHLNRSTSSGNRLKWTWSAWVKKTKNGADEDLFSGYHNSSNFTRIQIGDTGVINFINKTSGSQNGKLESNRLFRDNSAWYHFVIVWDSGNATAANRMRIYVNGVEETSFQSDTQPSQDQVSHVNQDSKTNYVGTFDGSGTFFNGYMAEVVLVDGQALDPTSFGEFDEDSPTIWKPKNVSGLTFGTNGFYLDFEDSSALGNDAAGSNNFTVNNLTAIDQSTDTCTNNFATSNPLIDSGTGYSQGNLDLSFGNGSQDNAGGTFGVSKGKWYWEHKIISSGNTHYLGIKSADSDLTSTSGATGTPSMYYSNAGNKVYNSSSGGSSYGSTFTDNDIIGIALDLDNNAIWFSKNGSWQNSATQSEIETGTTTNAAFSGTGSSNGFPSEQVYLPWIVGQTGGAAFTMTTNFGSPTFSISSGNADGNGYGNFEYSVPSGYYALNTKNLAEYG